MSNKSMEYVFAFELKKCSEFALNKLLERINSLALENDSGMEPCNWLKLKSIVGLASSDFIGKSCKMLLILLKE